MNKWLYIFVVIMTSISNSAIFCDDIDPYIKTGYDKENVVRAIKEDRKVYTGIYFTDWCRSFNNKY